MTTTDLPQRSTKGFGWKPDLPDLRDLSADEVLAPLQPVPPDLAKFSLREHEPEPAYDQGQLGSCTGNGIAFAVQFERAKQGLTPFRPSRLAIYYGERQIEGTISSDSGASIRDGFKVVAKVGAGPEGLWPYDIAQFATKPPDSYYAEAAKERVLRYHRVVRDRNQIKQAIYNGFPVVMGFSVYESFRSIGADGHMPMPQPNEDLLGGHCVVWTGWDDTLLLPNAHRSGALEARNSWSPGWGDQGHFWMPLDVALSNRLSSDFWIAQMVQA